VTETRT